MAHLRSPRTDPQPVKGGGGGGGGVRGWTGGKRTLVEIGFIVIASL